MRELVSVPQNIITPQTATPIIGFVQNTLVAAFLLTGGNGKQTFSTKQMFMDVLSLIWGKRKRKNDLSSFLERAYPYYPECIGKRTIESPDENGRPTEKDNFFISTPKIPGTLYLSYPLPPALKYMKQGVKIENGIILPDTAPLTKSVIGTRKKNGLIARVYVHLLIMRVFDPCQGLSDWISDTYHMLNVWYPSHCISIGLDDGSVTPKAKEIIRYKIGQGLIKERFLYDQYLDKMSRTTVKKVQEQYKQEYEQKANISLNSVRNVGARLVKEGMHYGKENNLVIALASGAKGDYLNCAQIAACLGQQNVSGKRISPTMLNNTKTLTCYLPGELTPRARGYITSCFKDGLAPDEVFYHSAAGREGVVDTSVKTKESGYMQKRIARALDNLQCNSAGMVVNEVGKIVSFLYGGDMLSADTPIFNKDERLDFFSKDLFEFKEPEDPSDAEEYRKLLERVLVLPFSNEVLKDYLKRSVDRIIRLSEGLVPKDYSQFSEKLEHLFNVSRCANGAPVGLIATSSITEKATQMTLSFFHSAGIGERSSTPLLVKLKELILLADGDKLHTPSCSFTPNIELTGKNVEEQLEELEKRFTPLLVEIRLSNIIKHTTVQRASSVLDDENPLLRTTLNSLSEPYPVEGYPWERVFSLLLTAHRVLPAVKRPTPGIKGYHPYVLRIKLSKYSLCRHGLTPLSVAIRLMEKTPYHVIGDPRDILLVKFPLSVTLQGTGQSANLSDYHSVTHTILPKLSKISISGIPGIRGVFYNHTLLQDKSIAWKVETDGTNIANLLSSPHVVTASFETNDIIAVHHHLGIAAAREILYSQLDSILSNTIDPRHYHLLADAMTYRGKPLKTYRTFIDTSSGPLTKCCFEDVNRSFANVAAKGKVDQCKSLVSNLLVGHRPRMGTNSIDPRLDERKAKSVLKDVSVLDEILNGMEADILGLLDLKMS